MKYADPVYPDTDDAIVGDGRSWVMAHVAWPANRSVIDSRHPCPIGLVIGKIPDFTHLGHQVCAYAYQLRGQLLTLWVDDPNSPGDDNVTMELDLSRTDQDLINVKSTVNVPNAPNCFFTQSYERRDPTGGWTHIGARPTTVRSRSEEGAVSLFVPGLDGKVWSAFWPAAAGSANWSGWFPIGANTFPIVI